jgi:hypothetical protein
VSINGVDRVRDSLKYLLYKFTTLPPEGFALGAEYENTLVSILVPSRIAVVFAILSYMIYNIDLSLNQFFFKI